MSKKGLKRAVEIFKYSDSEPNEVFTGLLHLAILPLADTIAFAALLFLT